MAVSEKTMELYAAMSQKNNEFVEAIEALPISRKDVRKLLKMFADTKGAVERFEYSLRTDK